MTPDAFEEPSEGSFVEMFEDSAAPALGCGSLPVRLFTQRKAAPMARAVGPQGAGGVGKESTGESETGTAAHA